jgi:DNA-binding NarL/FixJ family response regulator
MIRILIAHPSRLISDSLRNVLDKEQNVTVIGCALNTEELNFLLPHANVALIGADLDSKSNIFDTLHNIHLTHSHVKVIMLGVDDQPQNILRYIEAGAIGWIAQDESLEGVVRKVVAAREEKAYVSPAVAALMMERIAQLSRHQVHAVSFQGRQELVDELTSRECEVLDLIGAGYTNKDIASKLVIECGTVKNHVHNILRKLETTNRHDAVALYNGSKQSAVSLAI